MTDKLRSYGVAHRELIPESIHVTKQYENNRAEQSHEGTRVCASDAQVQISWAGSGRDLGRHLVRAEHYRNLRESAFADWSRAVA